MTVRVRGIYATALTALLEDVVQPSAAIRDRLEAELPRSPADARLETTPDRQGVGVHGHANRVDDVSGTLEAVGRDTLRWSADVPADGVFAGQVTETLGSGALVDVRTGTGFLPNRATSRRIEVGERIRVQVSDPQPPWVDDRPVLDTDIRIHGGLLDLVRGRRPDAGGPTLVDVLPASPPDGWGTDWAPGALDESHEALAAALEHASERAESLDDALANADSPSDRDLGPYWTGTASEWLWFGRESRFALDDVRREVVQTMPGHHRLKAATDAAGAAVDFAEAVCPAFEGEFPFEAATRQFGPVEGDRIAISHGKPEGDRYDLGTGEVVERDPEGSVTIHREMTAGGSYDALEVERAAGDVAVTTISEGRWWYPTVYRGQDGTERGTYVNICTPVEIFPTAVRYVDLHVDVIKHADGRVERVDDDELDGAVTAGHVSERLAERARDVASAVESAL